jgi:hypothetical protein
VNNIKQPTADSFSPELIALGDKIKASVLAEIGKPENWPMFDKQLEEARRRVRVSGNHSQQAIDAAVDDTFKELDAVALWGSINAIRHMMRCRAQARRRERDPEVVRW